MSHELEYRRSDPSKLRFAVIGSLIVQVILSFALLFVAVQMDRTVRKASVFEALIYQQNKTFDDTTRTIEELLNAMESGTQRVGLVQKLQRRLLDHSADANAIIASIEQVSGERSELLGKDSFVSVIKFEEIRPLIDDLLQDLNTLSTITPEDYIYVSQFARQVNIALAHNSNIVRGLNILTEQVVIDATSLAAMLGTLRLIIFSVILSTVVALAGGLILPALKELAQAIDRESSLRIYLAEMARTDRLTGLLNRTGIEDAVRKANESEPFAYAIIDLNNFKPINDTFGHAAGDAVLNSVADRLRRLVSPNATVARIGGDEFAVLEPTITTIKDCEQFARVLADVFSDVIVYGGRNLWVGAAIGITLSDEVPRGFNALSTAADTALYQVKMTRKSGYAIFSSEIAQSAPNLERKLELRQALENGEICPWYQPIHHLKSGDVRSLEALCRWQHPMDGLLSPAKFLQDIERYDLHLDLADSMLTHALKQLSKWGGEGFKLVPISINISADTLASECGAELLRERLENYPDFISLIIFEITEDVFLPRIATAVSKSIEQFKKLGVRVAIDDFGSGYASYRHLNEFTFDELKIDASFIADIGTKASSDVMLKSFLSIGRAFGCSVVAEGVETKEQAMYLQQMGCDLVQGFLYSLPSSPDKIERFLNRNTLRSKAS